MSDITRRQVLLSTLSMVVAIDNPLLETLAQPSSALDIVNAKRLRNKIADNIKEIYLDFNENFHMEPVDSITRKIMAELVNAYMQTLVNSKLVFEYSVTCDESNNPPKDIYNTYIGLDVLWKDHLFIGKMNHVAIHPKPLT